MKKIGLLLLLFTLHGATFAQDKPIIVADQMYYARDTTRTLRVLGMDGDLYIKKLINAFGNPDSNTSGNLTWHKISIKGFDGMLQLHLRDGITTHNPRSRNSSWSPFTGETDKQQKLTGLTSDQRRHTDLEITDQEGKNVIISDGTEQTASEFLAGIIR